MSTEQILQKHHILKYNGKLIFPDEDGTHFWVLGKKKKSLAAAKNFIDLHNRRNIFGIQKQKMTNHAT